MSKNHILTFDTLELKKETVSIGGKTYTLTELDGLGRDKYQQFRSERTKFVDGKFAGISDSAGLTTFLIALSLTDASGAKVEQKTLDTWPARVTEALFKVSSALSHLSGEAETELKEKAKNA